jgi:hypothetical protein
LTEWGEKAFKSALGRLPRFWRGHWALSRIELGARKGSLYNETQRNFCVCRNGEAGFARHYPLVWYELPTLAEVQYYTISIVLSIAKVHVLQCLQPLKPLSF